MPTKEPSVPPTDAPTHSPTKFCRDFYVGLPCIMRLQTNVDLILVIDSSQSVSNEEYDQIIDANADQIEDSFPEKAGSTLGFALYVL